MSRKDKIYAILEKQWPVYVFSGNGVKLDIAAYELEELIDKECEAKLQEAVARAHERGFYAGQADPTARIK